MMVSSRPRLVAQVASVAFVAVLVGLVASGCEDKHIGRACSLDVGGAGGSSAGTESATINSQAVECPERICLQAAPQNGPTNTGSLCSAECSSDDDCSDGQTSSDMSSMLCKGGFKCAIATTVGDFCCKKLCICKDFLNPADYNTTPPLCVSGSGGTCKNVH
ncbi:MAG TPA: hypothetical protein VHJ20_03960 [Polyangia bacterium]|nr:hypothetical protein [Polyangia bacterium]